MGNNSHQIPPPRPTSFELRFLNSAEAIRGQPVIPTPWRLC
jgi:hypothetical protein